MMSLPFTCLRTYPAAPAMIASKSASSSSNEVSIRQASVGMTGTELAAQLDAVSVGKPNIENCHVWGRGGDPKQSLLDGAGFADDLEVVLGLEHVAHTPTDNLVVVDQEDAEGHRGDLPTGSPAPSVPNGELTG